MFKPIWLPSSNSSDVFDGTAGIVLVDSSFQHYGNARPSHLSCLVPLSYHLKPEREKNTEIAVDTARIEPRPSAQQASSLSI